jgi:hypothetical protein
MFAPAGLQDQQLVAGNLTERTKIFQGGPRRDWAQAAFTLHEARATGTPKA